MSQIVTCFLMASVFAAVFSTLNLFLLRNISNDNEHSSVLGLDFCLENFKVLFDWWDVIYNDVKFVVG